MQPSYPIDYVIYVDESGDHGLININPEFPVFVLVFCIFKVPDYIEKIVPRAQGFKFKYFKHDMVILHERDIRRGSGYFSKFRDASIKDSFIQDLNIVITEADFEIVCCLIDKINVRNKGVSGQQVYSLAMRRGLESICDLLPKQLGGAKIPVIFESRGKSEDALLSSEFHSMSYSGSEQDVSQLFDLVIASKKVNSTGLQLADMVARPLAQKWLKPDQRNRAYEIVELKLRKQVVIE